MDGEQKIDIVDEDLKENEKTIHHQKIRNG